VDVGDGERDGLGLELDAGGGGLGQCVGEGPEEGGRVVEVGA